MSSYAHFATPTCRQAAMQMYRVCKCAEDWRPQLSNARVRRKQQSSIPPLLSPVSHVAFYASMLSHQTANSIHSYRGLPTSGRNEMGINAYYSYISVSTKNIYSHQWPSV